MLHSGGIDGSEGSQKKSVSRVQVHTLVTPDRSVLGQKSVDGCNSSRATKK